MSFLPALSPEARDLGVVDIAPASRGVGRIAPRLRGIYDEPFHRGLDVIALRLRIRYIVLRM